MRALEGLNHHRQRNLIGHSAQDDLGGEKLLPCSLQAEDGQRADGGQRQRQHHAEEGGHMAAAVNFDRFLQLLGQRRHVAAQEKRIAADARAYIQEDQSGLGADQPVLRRADALQHQKLRNDAQEAGQHQCKQINAE